MLPVPLQFVASHLAGGVDESARAGFDIRPSHFVERHGGLLIVVLGESIVAIGIGVTDLTLDAITIATAVLGLAIAAGLWWACFGVDEKQAEISLRAAALNDRVRMALFGYFYPFVPMLLGITSFAAGENSQLAQLRHASSCVQRSCSEVESDCIWSGTRYFVARCTFHRGGIDWW